MAKTDLKKELRDLYFPSAKEVALVDVPPMNFLMIDGSGDPNTAPTFKESIEALYGVSYTLRFILKKSGLGDYTVLPLGASGGRTPWAGSPSTRETNGSGRP